jgi:hypothetical protein
MHDHGKNKRKRADIAGHYVFISGGGFIQTAFGKVKEAWRVIKS